MSTRFVSVTAPPNARVPEAGTAASHPEAPALYVMTFVYVKPLTPTLVIATVCAAGFVPTYVAANESAFVSSAIPPPRPIAVTLKRNGGFVAS